MAPGAAGRDAAESAPPPVAPGLDRAAVPWFDALRARLAAMADRERLAHGILLVGQPGAGQADLGLWLAMRVLCRAGTGGACGACTDCRLFLAGNHPDFSWIRVPLDRKNVSIEQVRELAASLTLRSYRGGAKAALIDPAEAMNIHSFNALLKTLEEPAAETYLFLATSRNDRIPRTVASRCVRLRVPVPARAAALAWLHRQGVTEDADGLLTLAHGAPFLAAEYAEAGLAEIDQELRAALEEGAKSPSSLLAKAPAWAEQAPAARLFWLESWLAGTLRAAATSRDLVNNNRLPWLREPGRDSKIRAGYRLLDELRDVRRLVGGSLNQPLLFEGALVSLAAWLAGGDRKVQE